MRIYSSLWNADEWATRGGLVKTDWSQAPFTASYRNFNAATAAAANSARWLSQELDAASQKRLKWVQKNYMIYNYCTDTKRFPHGLPLECTTIWSIGRDIISSQPIYVYIYIYISKYVCKILLVVVYIRMIFVCNLSQVDPTFIFVFVYNYLLLSPIDWPILGFCNFTVFVVYMCLKLYFDHPENMFNMGLTVRQEVSHI